MDKKEHDGFMRGGLHQIIDTEETKKIIDKRWKDGEMILPNTFYTTLNPQEKKILERQKYYTYGLDTGEGDSTTFTIERPFKLSEDALARIDEVLEDDTLIDRINRLVIKDTDELYLRELINRVRSKEERWDKLKQKAIDYRFNKTGSHEDGRYCVAISVTDLLKWMEELEEGDK